MFKLREGPSRASVSHRRTEDCEESAQRKSTEETLGGMGWTGCFENTLIATVYQSLRQGQFETECFTQNANIHRERLFRSLTNMHSNHMLSSPVLQKMIHSHGKASNQKVHKEQSPMACENALTDAPTPPVHPSKPPQTPPLDAEANPSPSSSAYHTYK